MPRVVEVGGVQVELRRAHRQAPVTYDELAEG